MVCIHCQQNTQVINSRLQKRANAVWRRRRCLGCQAIFTTHEIADLTALWRVTSQKQAMSPFSRDRLLISLYKSLQHRPSALDDASGLTATVISQLLTLAKDGLITTMLIAQTAQTTLARFDLAAATHYQAFHKY
jgi:transcriptional repressor NrdR